MGKRGKTRLFGYFFKSRNSKYGWLFPLAVLFGLGIGALPPYLANILEIVVNRSAGNNDFTIEAIVWLCVGYLVAYLLSNVGFRLTTSALYAKIERGLVDDMTNAYKDEQAPDVEKIISLANEVVTTYYRLFFSTLITMSSFVFAVVYMAFINWLSLIPAMVGIGIILILGIFFNKRTFKLNKILTESNASLAAAVSTLSNAFGSSTYAYSKANYESLADASHKQVNSKGYLNAYEGLIESLNGFISSAVCVATYVVAISMALNGVVNGGQMAALTAVGCTIANPFFNAKDVLMCRRRNKELLPQVKEILG